jgi:hypothetical protein
MVNNKGAANMQIDVNTIKTVYSGKPGCMCGCRGKYTKPEESTRSVKIIVGKLAKDPATKYDAQAKCFYLQTPTRMLAAYTTDA